MVNICGRCFLKGKVDGGRGSKYGGEWEEKLCDVIYGGKVLENNVLAGDLSSI